MKGDGDVRERERRREHVERAKERKSFKMTWHLCRYESHSHSSLLSHSLSPLSPLSPSLPLIPSVSSVKIQFAKSGSFSYGERREEREREGEGEEEERERESATSLSLLRILPSASPISLFTSAVRVGRTQAKLYSTYGSRMSVRRESSGERYSLKMSN